MLVVVPSRHFSAKLREKTAHSGAKKFKPILCISEYGDLLNVKPLTKPVAVQERGPEDFR